MTVENIRFHFDFGDIIIFFLFFSPTILKRESIASKPALLIITRTAMRRSRANNSKPQTIYKHIKLHFFRQNACSNKACARVLLVSEKYAGIFAVFFDLCVMFRVRQKTR